MGFIMKKKLNFNNYKNSCKHQKGLLNIECFQNYNTSKLHPLNPN
jgi:hypothetical protein